MGQKYIRIIDNNWLEIRGTVQVQASKMPRHLSAFCNTTLIRKRLTATLLLIIGIQSYHPAERLARVQQSIEKTPVVLVERGHLGTSRLPPFS
jgi:hypothetical protein